MSALTSLLVRDDVVSVRQIEEALQRHVVDGGELDTAVLELTDIPEDVLTAYRAASERARPVGREEVMGASAATRALLDPELAIALRVVPVAHDQRTLSIAVVNPLGAPEEAALQAQCGLTISWRISCELRVEAALAKFYGATLPARFAALLPRVDACSPGELPIVEPLQVTPFAALSADLMHGFDDSVDFETALEAAFDRVSAAPLPVINMVPASQDYPMRPPPMAAERSARTAPQPLAAPPRRSERPAAPVPDASAVVTEAPNVAVGTGAAGSAGRKRVPTLRRGQARIPQGPLTPAMAAEALTVAEERDAVVEVFFRFARQYFDTTVLFALRDDRALGLDAYNASALVEVRDVSMAILRGSAVDDMQRSLLPRVVDLSRKDEDRMLALVLKRLADQPCALIPVCVKRRVVSFVYGDRAGERFRLDDLAPLLGLLPHVSRAFERIIRTRKALGLNAHRVSAQPRDRALQHAQTQRAYDLPAALPRASTRDLDDSSIALAEERTRHALNSLGVPRSPPPPPEPKSAAERAALLGAAPPPTAAGGVSRPMDAREYWAPSGRSLVPEPKQPAARSPAPEARLGRSLVPGPKQPATRSPLPEAPTTGPHRFAPPPRSPVPPDAGRYLAKSARNAAATAKGSASSQPSAATSSDPERALAGPARGVRSPLDDSALPSAGLDSSLPPTARSPLPPGAGRYMSRAARSAVPPTEAAPHPQPSAAKAPVQPAAPRTLPPDAGRYRSLPPYDPSRVSAPSDPPGSASARAGRSPLPPAAARSLAPQGRSRSSAPPLDSSTRGSRPPPTAAGILPPLAAETSPFSFDPRLHPELAASPRLLADASSGLSLSLPEATEAEPARAGSPPPISGAARLSNPPPARYFSRPPAGAGRYSSLVTPLPEPGQGARQSARPSADRSDDGDTQPLRSGRNLGSGRPRPARSSAPAPRNVPLPRASVHPGKPAPGTGSYYAEGLTTEVISVPEDVPALSAPASQRPPAPTPPLMAASEFGRGASSDVVAEFNESAAGAELIGAPLRAEPARPARGVRSYPTARDPELRSPGAARADLDRTEVNSRELDPTLAPTQQLAAVRVDDTPLTNALPVDSESELRSRIAALIVELCASRSEQDSPALAQLRELGEPALTALLARFPGPLWFDRRRPHARVPLARDVGPIARALVGFGETTLLRLPALLGSADTETRYYATLFASERVHPVLLAPLLERLFDDDAQIRLLVRDALPHYRRVPGFRRLPERLRAHAASPDAPLRARLAALDAIGVLRDAGSVDTLIELVAHSDKQLCVPAHRALVGITCQDFDKSTKKWRAWYQDNALRHRVEWLIDALLHSEQSLRAAAGVELQKMTQVYYGYVAAAPKRDRELAQKRYLDWWRTEGHLKFAS